MVFRKNLILFTLFLTFVFIIVLKINNVNACHLEQQGYYYNDHSSILSLCPSPDIYAYDFSGDTGGCAMGFAAGLFYNCYFAIGIILPGCTCSGPDAKWYTSGSNGQICKIRWGLSCGVLDGGVFGGEDWSRYDSTTGTCVKCSGPFKTEGWKCVGSEGQKVRSWSNVCESACGADEACDEKNPNTFYDRNGDGLEDLYCDSSCKAYFCNSSTECNSTAGKTCQYSWVSSKKAVWWWNNPVSYDENGSPIQECFDGYDNDCDGYKDCADPGCVGKTDPNTGVTCCQTASDCPACSSGVQPVCENNKCKCYENCGGQYPPCDSNHCCTYDIDKSKPGTCVSPPTISSDKKWLCVA